jgi:hypothetical protein
MNKKQVQESIKRLDSAVAQLNINRQGHMVLVNDLKIIQQCCMDYFDNEDELKNKSTKKEKK